MSTIVGVEKDGRVAIAWDSMDSVGPTRSVGSVAPPKVLRVGRALIGCSGLTVYRNVLDHYLASMKAPVFRDERSIFGFFVRFWRDMHKRYHYVEDRANSEDPSPFADLDAEFLIVNPYGIFRVREILSVSRFARFCAVGSGASHAEGALQVLYEESRSAKDIAETAVRVALQFDAASGGNVHVLDVAKRLAQRRRLARTRDTAPGRPRVSASKGA